MLGIGCQKFNTDCLYCLNAGGCAGSLEGRIVWGLNRSPKSLAAARSNILAALGHLGMLTAQTCPRGLVHEVEHILQVSFVSQAPFSSTKAEKTALCNEQKLMVGPSFALICLWTGIWRNGCRVCACFA